MAIENWRVIKYSFYFIFNDSNEINQYPEQIHLRNPVQNYFPDDIG